ncbi:MAG: ATP-binding cassette domain-containing protein [Bacteroidales bacterium]|nr:ATP-binding cassette domain-containing protein [Bacteroidales bacterium]
MIRIINATKAFNDNIVLDNVSINFDAGKTNLVIGRSGSGKTVLLKTIVGLLELDKGEIWYDKTRFDNLDFKSRKTIRREIGMLFQGSALFDSMTVEENVMFKLDMFTNMSRAEKKKRVDYCLDRVNIMEANSLLPSELSGGMRKRVAIARAIVLNPGYLFCDEPNSGLDPETAILIDKLIKDITDEFKMTTIVNTHDMNSVMEIGEKVIFISGGRKQWEGTNMEILKSGCKPLNDFIFASELTKQLKH